MALDQIVIIGNGFDKSIGCPSSYREFLFFLLKKEITKVCNEENHQPNKFYEAKNPIFTFHFIRFVGKENFLSAIDKIKTIKDVRLFFEKDIVMYRFISPFIEELFNTENDNWGDIEVIYYKSLLSISKKDNQNIPLLNSQLEFIRDELLKYLSDLNLVTSAVHRFGPNDFSDILLKETRANGVNNSSTKKEVRLDNICFINFNYTNFLNEIISKTEFKNSKVISIHGNINNKEDVIFGYGDEDNEDFNNLKNDGRNVLLKHIKTYNYQNNDNYKKLLVFLSRSKDFQVVIYGHSCSLSDKVLLREIFENNKCKSIRVLHYKGSKNYYDILYNISRVFQKNKQVREKVNPFDELDEIPQIDLVK
ncbi:hypothetical protein PI23P_00840 [Polaribacter irgensii 23-P]|uniref:Bacteriophage abortive infection AbiH n=1 Tax=Polaribacter irgensii 23-P TaxID=313594 RepID=A4C2A5_9FLAO|nr:AbiH family protein [Polaribacter irgensii]EAR11706.1 hypothetical protein PI23P_00840 [Polaribacter irgensii 23-P]